MNNQTETIKPDAVSNDVGTATNVASPESVPAVTDKPKSVKLELSEEEADMIQTLLNDYVLAYRSDRSVDYKPEPVPREKSRAISLCSHSTSTRNYQSNL